MMLVDLSLLALLCSAFAIASPAPAELEASALTGPNLVKDPGFEANTGSPWIYTGSIAQRRTGPGAESGKGYGDILIPTSDGPYPQIAQNLTIPKTANYTLLFDYAVVKNDPSKNQLCLFQTGVGEGNFQTSMIPNGKTSGYTSYQITHTVKAGTYAKGLTFFLYCGVRPGAAIHVDNFELRQRT